MPSRSRAPGSGPPLTGMPPTASQSRTASRTRPQTPAQIAQRVSACNALTAVSMAAHHASTAALMGAPPSQLREQLNRIRAALAAAERMPGIARQADTERATDP